MTNPVTELNIVWPSEQSEDRQQGVSFVDAAERLRQRGVIVLKNAIDPSEISLLGEQLLPKFEEIQDFRQSMDLFQEEELAGMKKYSLVKKLCGPPLFPILQEFFGTEEIILMGRNIHSPRFQRQQEKESGLPFHQDGGFLNVPLLRAWLLLYPGAAGETAANVEFLPGIYDTIYPIETNPDSKQYGWLEMSHDVRDELMNTRTIWAPKVSRGDILLFYGNVPHRTHFPVGAQQSRLSLEPSFFPMQDDLLEYLLGADSHGVFRIRSTGIEHVTKDNGAEPGR